MHLLPLHKATYDWACFNYLDGKYYSVSTTLTLPFLICAGCLTTQVDIRGNFSRGRGNRRGYDDVIFLKGVLHLKASYLDSISLGEGPAPRVWQLGGALPVLT